MTEDNKNVVDDLQLKKNELQLKKNELASLQADILSDEQKETKKNLEIEIKNLETQLEELELQKDTELNKTKQETTNLKQGVAETTEVIGTSTTILEYIKGNPDLDPPLKPTTMYTKLEQIEKSGEIPNFTIEKFAKDISTTVETYLKESFKISGSEQLTISDSVLSSLSVGIQFSMMDALTTSGNSGADFFSAFSKTNTNDASSTLTGLTKAFGSGGMISSLIGGGGKTNEFYTLANKFQNFIGYVSRYCGEGKVLGDGTKIKELANPNAFKMFLQKDIWTNDALLLSKKPTDPEIGFTISPEAIPPLSKNPPDADFTALYTIANNENMPITPKTVESIMKALPTAQNLLSKRAGYKDKAIDLMTTVTGLLDINVFGFGSVGALIGISDPTTLFRTKEGKKKGGVLNFVLKAMGFNNGVEGLYQEYIRQSIDKNFVAGEERVMREDFIKKSIQGYNDSLSGYTGQATETVLGLPVIEDVEMKAKIPTEYDAIKDTLSKNIVGKEQLINPTVFAALGVNVPTKKDQSGTLVLDTATFDTTKIPADFMDKYLKTTMTSLIKNADFMSGIKTSEEFVLALSGGLVCGNCFSAGVALGMETILSYKAIVPTEATSTTPGTTETIHGQVDFSNANFQPEQIKNINFLLDEMKILGITNPYTQIGILSVVSKESGFVPQAEVSYMKTSNEQIRKTFGDRVSAYSESELEALKKDEQKFFSVVYAQYRQGPTGEIQPQIKNFTWETGNTQPGDGYTYRGRGFNQITFKSVYKQYGDMIGEDLVANPDRLNDPIVAAKVALAFFKKGNDGKDLSGLSFTNKEDAARYFARVNGGNANTRSEYEINAVNASQKFEVQANPQTVGEAPFAIETIDHPTYKANTFFVGDSITLGHTNYPPKNGIIDEIYGYRSLGNDMGGKDTKWMNSKFSEVTNSIPKPETVMILGGINNLRNEATRNMLGEHTPKRTAQQMADSVFNDLKSMVDKATAARIKYSVGTILPFGDFLLKEKYYATEGTTVSTALQLINDKIKTTWPNNYVDYYAEFNDPSKPGCMKSGYSGNGDGLHPDINGYKKMQEMAFEKRKQLHVVS